MRTMTRTTAPMAAIAAMTPARTMIGEVPASSAAVSSAEAGDSSMDSSSAASSSAASSSSASSSSSGAASATASSVTVKVRVSWMGWPSEETTR